MRRMKFRLLPGAGLHVQDGRTYKAGEVVESDSNLATRFAGKFELVSGRPPDEEKEPPSETRTPFDVPAAKMAEITGQADEADDGDTQDDGDEDGPKPSRRSASRSRSRR